jgi:hypothetical protein
VQDHLRQHYTAIIKPAEIFDVVFVYVYNDPDLFSTRPSHGCAVFEGTCNLLLLGSLFQVIRRSWKFPKEKEGV